jgi:hypothetical protein
MRETSGQRRRVQQAFVARGLRAAEEARRTGIYYDAAEIRGELQRGLDARRTEPWAAVRSAIGEAGRGMSRSCAG